APNEIEGVFWHTTDPDLVFYASGNRIIRYHVSSGVKDVVHTFTFCPGNTSFEPHGFKSWDSNEFSLLCSSSGAKFFYRLDTDTVSGLTTTAGSLPFVSASGAFGYRDGNVVDSNMTFVRSLDVGSSGEHSSLGRLVNGHDTYNAVQFDTGPRGSGVGSLVTHDMTTGAARVIVGPATGFPYPPSSTHMSALAYKQPGWVFTSIVGNPAGQTLLDNELVLSDTNTGRVCRVGRHRSFGKENTKLENSYWAEPHVVASPSGTRALFASDWGNGSTVDTYALELPGYAWFDVPSGAGDFDGDGMSDVLWLNRPSGQLALWMMDGTTVRAEVNIRTLPDATWEVAATGDYNGDGKADVLLRQKTTGQLRVWLMNGATVTTEATIGVASNLLGLVAGSGVFNGDGRSDIAWYHAGTGAVTVWLMNGAVVTSQAVATTLSDLTWRILGSGDYDGDGKSDLLLRKGASGTLQVLFMNGTQVASQGTVATVADANWQVLGTGDNNGDGRADLLLRNRASGAILLLLMNGISVIGQGVVATISDLNWQVVASGDFDGNGKSDIQLRSRTTGAGFALFMNGVTVASAGALPTVADQGWQGVRVP
ncbi:MAG: FG-GAP-like repeat-containing protein, partial [Solirubrobacterales bacterium]